MRKNLFAIFAVILLGACSKVNTPDYNGVWTGGSGTHDPRFFGRGGGGSGGGANFDGIDMGTLMDYLFVFSRGSVDANWQGASKGYIGDIAVNGTSSAERTSGYVPYAGTITTSDVDLNAWQKIISDNSTQVSVVYSATSTLADLSNNIESVFTQVNNQTVTTGFENTNPHDIDGLNTQNGIAETYVINMRSGFDINYKIEITGDAEDFFIFRWDTDGNFSNGYQGKVKFSNGGGLIPNGGLTPSNFLSVAGDITASGGGTNPPAPYPQGPRDAGGTGSLIDGAADFNGGGFFTGYWVTSGQPKNFSSGQPYGPTSAFSNAIFVGGWYTKTGKFSMTSGTSGVHIAP